MSTFDKREAGFEQQFAHDEAIQFKVHARAAKLVGLWAAERLGKVGVVAEDYANGLVKLEVGSPTDNAVFAKIRQDFVAAGVEQSDHQIQRHYEQSLAQAKHDVATA